FFNHYIVGLLLNNLVLLSLLLSITALCAYTWRLFDVFGVRWFLMDWYEALGRALWLTDNALDFVLGLADDFYVAFLPAALTFFSWGLIWTVSRPLGLLRHPRHRQKVAAVTKYLLIAAGLFVLIGCAVILGNGDTGFGIHGAFTVPLPVLAAMISAPLTSFA